MSRPFRFRPWVLLLLLSAVPPALALHAQQLLFNTAGALHEVDPENCSTSFLSALDRTYFDITFTPDGRLWGIDPAGVLYVIDPATGAATFVRVLPTGFYNTLTADGNGRLYTFRDQQLVIYDPATDGIDLRGSIPFVPAGDLTFVRGELYLASDGNGIIRIDVDDAASSVPVVADVFSGLLTGIVQAGADCANPVPYGITGDFSSQTAQGGSIYRIDLEAGTAGLICDIPLTVFGAASTTEFQGSSSLEITDATGAYPDCEEEGTVTITTRGGLGELRFQRFNGPTQPEGTFADLPQGAQLFRVTDESGCSDTVTVNLTGPGEVVIGRVTPSFTDCDPSRVVLTTAATGEDPLRYSYDLGASFSDDPTATFAARDTFEVRVRNGQGCTRFVRGVVPELVPVLVADVAVDAVCGDSVSTLTVVAEGSATDFESALDDGPFGPDPTFDDVPPGSYTVRVRDGNGCDTSVPDLLVFPQATITDRFVEDTRCGLPNGAIRVGAAGGTFPYRFALGDGPFEFQDSFLNLTAGTYVVSLQDAGDCPPVRDTLTVAASAPVTFASLTAEPATCETGRGAVRVAPDETTGALFVGIGDSVGALPNFFNDLPPGEVLVTLEDQRGCRLSTPQLIRPAVCNVYLPTAFSPNGDGVNDTFRPYLGTRVRAQNMFLAIYDRWGGLVYETDDPAAALTGWDGTVGGRAGEIGVYTYVLEAGFVNGYALSRKGAVTLLR